MSNLTYQDYGVRFKTYISPFNLVKLDSTVQTMMVPSGVCGAQITVPASKPLKDFFIRIGNTVTLFKGNNTVSLNIPDGIPRHYNTIEITPDKKSTSLYSSSIIINDSKINIINAPRKQYWSINTPQDVKNYKLISKRSLLVKVSTTANTKQLRNIPFYFTKSVLIGNSHSVAIIDGSTRVWSNTTLRENWFQVIKNGFDNREASGVVVVRNSSNLKNHFNHLSDIKSEYYTAFIKNSGDGAGGINLIKLNLISGKPCTILLSNKDNNQDVTIKSINNLPSSLIFNDYNNTIEGVPMVSGRYDCGIILSNGNKIMLILNINPLSLFTGI